LHVSIEAELLKQVRSQTGVWERANENKAFFKPVSQIQNLIFETSNVKLYIDAVANIINNDCNSNFLITHISISSTKQMPR